MDDMKHKRTYDAVICGYLCVDLVPIFKKHEGDAESEKLDFLRPGMLTELDGMTFTLGGLVGNTGLVLHKIGKNVVLNGLIGRDYLGEFVVRQLDKYEITGDIASTAAAGTAFGIVLAPPGVDRLFLESPGCSRLFGLDSVNAEVIADSKLLHFGYIPLLKQFFENGGEQLRELLETSQGSGTVTSMDLSLPDSAGETAGVDWRAILGRVLPFTDILLPSIEEILCMMMPDVYSELSQKYGGQHIIDHVSWETLQRLGRELLAHGVKILMIKMAHRGVYLLTGDIATADGSGMLGLDVQAWSHQELFCEAYPLDETRAMNASGAGDTAAAAFLAALLDGAPPASALKLSAMAGRESLYCNDLYTELASWDEISENIDRETVNVLSMEDLLSRISIQ